MLMGFWIAVYQFYFDYFIPGVMHGSVFLQYCCMHTMAFQASIASAELFVFGV